ncbi:hypothetical protein I4U23_028592 [Adineta vaga]|nr:hypothetical protein I4U23_028592 [Adineta vaga]
MLFPSSRPHRIPPSTTDSQYDTTGYSTSFYNKWPQSSAKTDIYTTQNGGSTSNSKTSQYPSMKRRYTNGNEPLSNILNYDYSQSEQQEQPIYSTTSSQRPTVNYLLP